VDGTSNADHDADCNHLERKCHASCPLEATSHDRSGYDSSYEALEQVSSHASYVSDVVSYAVSDGGRVACVVFGNVVLNLSD